MAKSYLECPGGGAEVSLSYPGCAWGGTEVFRELPRMPWEDEKEEMAYRIQLSQLTTFGLISKALLSYKRTNFFSVPPPNTLKRRSQNNFVDIRQAMEEERLAFFLCGSRVGLPALSCGG